MDYKRFKELLFQKCVDARDEYLWNRSMARNELSVTKARNRFSALSGLIDESGLLSEYLDWLDLNGKQATDEYINRLVAW